MTHRNESTWLAVHEPTRGRSVQVLSDALLDRRWLRGRCGNADGQSQPTGFALDLDSPRHAREVDASRRRHELDAYDCFVGGNVDDPSGSEEDLPCRVRRREREIDDVALLVGFDLHSLTRVIHALTTRLIRSCRNRRPQVAS
jgi:hypothetical protein